MPYIDEYAGDITLSSMGVRSVRPTVAENPRAGTPEEAWLKHLYTVVFEEVGELQEMPVTYSGFFSYGQRAEDVSYEKASSMSMQKHAMFMSKKATDFINPGQVP